MFELTCDETADLNEIADMPLAMQSKLRRALHEGQVRPVGGSSNLQVNFKLNKFSNP